MTVNIPTFFAAGSVHEMSSFPPAASSFTPPFPDNHTHGKGKKCTRKKKKEDCKNCGGSFEWGQAMLPHVTPVLQDKLLSKLGAIKLSDGHRILFLGSLLFA